jgi:hypothetical protein
MKILKRLIKEFWWVLPLAILIAGFYLYNQYNEWHKWDSSPNVWELQKDGSTLLQIKKDGIWLSK